MFMAKRGLGKGLETLFETKPDDIVAESKNGIVDLKINSVEPNKDQPRKTFDSEKIDALAESIKEHGLIQPIIVTEEKGGMYKIVAGERRWRAAKKAGLKEIPCVIREYSGEEVAEIALIENLQREDLNPIEEALGYRLLLDDYNLTQELISQRIGKSRSAIANSLRLLSLDDQIKKLLISGEISSGHARAILSLESSELRLALVKRIIEDGLNVRQAEGIAKQLNKTKPKKVKKDTTAYDVEIENLENRIASTLGTKVKISHSPKKGRIEIEYYGNEDLDRILTMLNLS